MPRLSRIGNALGVPPLFHRARVQPGQSTKIALGREKTPKGCAFQGGGDKGVGRKAGGISMPHGEKGRSSLVEGQQGSNGSPRAPHKKLCGVGWGKGRHKNCTTPPPSVLSLSLKKLSLSLWACCGAKILALHRAISRRPRAPQVLVLQWVLSVMI